MERQTTLRRKDARRVHAAILDAAAERLQDDPESSFADIARQAGVGQATVYRHFSDRRALIVALLEQAIDRVGDFAAGQDPVPGRFERLLRATVAEQVACQGLMSVIRAEAVADDRIDGIVQRVVELFRLPLAEAKAAGTVRGDLEAEEMPMLFAMLDGALMAAKPGARQETADRMLELLVDGLAVERLTPQAEKTSSSSLRP
jgi:AcrR family transcriptional regulator